VLDSYIFYLLVLVIVITFAISQLCAPFCSQPYRLFIIVVVIANVTLSPDFSFSRRIMLLQCPVRPISQIANLMVEQVGIILSVDNARLCWISATECLPPKLRQEIVIVLNQLRYNGRRQNDQGDSQFVSAVGREVVSIRPQLYVVIVD
jgi:hypothetical protein